MATDLAGVYGILYQSGSITATSFTVTHDIKTAVWVIEYRCLTLARTFQSYHINIFNNIQTTSPINVASTAVFSSTVDYTTLATN